MANNTINTRIKNKVDSYQSWKGSTGLLNGEIAIVRVPTGDTYTNPVNGKTEPVIELLMKVGDGTSTFDNLPWLSARAADVYDWAKKGTIEEVPVVVGGVSSTIGAYLTKVDNNAAGIAGISEKVDVAKVSTAISGAIDTLKADLVHVNTKGTNEIVKAVTQANGQVTVTYGKISADELPALTTGMIKTGDAQYDTLDEMLGHINSEIAGFASKISAEDSGSGNYVKGVAYNNGKFTVTKGDIALADVPAVNADHIQANAVTTDKIANSAVTDDKIESVSASKVNYASDKTLPEKIEEVEALIAGVNTAIAGGVHFIGTTDTEPTTSTVNGKPVINGDVVIYAGKEYIYVKPEGQAGSWEQLGDVTRIGALEDKVNGLDYDGGDFGTSKFVTKVTQADGKIEATYGQPTSADVSHNSTTVKVTLEGQAAAIEANTTKLANLSKNTVQEAINEAKQSVVGTINGLNVASDPTSGGEAAETENFVTQVRQTNGQVSYSRKTLPVATTAKKGIVTLGAEGGAATYEVVADIDARVEGVEGNYVRFNNADKKLYVGKSGVDEIIFDCGGAPSKS